MDSEGRINFVKKLVCLIIDSDEKEVDPYSNTLISCSSGLLQDGRFSFWVSSTAVKNMRIVLDGK